MEMLIKKSLSIQIYEHLKNEIIFQKIAYGSKLTIKDIQDKFNVSSTPARDALSLLGSENLVEIVVNQGAKVCEFNLIESLEIYELHKLLDLYAIEKALNCGNHLEIANDLKNNLDKSRDASTKEILELDSQFHSVFYKYIQNSDIAKIKYQNQSRFQVIAYQANNFYSNEHFNIYEAVKNNNVKLAIESMSNHYLHGEDKIRKFFANK